MMASIAKVNIIVRLRINSDGDGVRTVIFLQDCPLSCVWCCNPETRFGDGYKEVNPEQLYELISRDQIYFDATGGGITFSGGEPLLQSDFIVEFLNTYDTYGRLFNCNIETSLFASFETVEKLIPYINDWYVDFKAFDEKLHIAYTGVSNNLIKENIARLSQAVDKRKIIITYPIITGLNDSRDNVDNMIAFMKQHGLYKIELHPYRKNRGKKNEKLGLKYDAIEPLSPKTIAGIKIQLSEQGIEIVNRSAVVERRKCDELKRIRRAFCDSSMIDLSIEECSYKGRCKGTCPKCEQELDYINEWRREHNA